MTALRQEVPILGSDRLRRIREIYESDPLRPGSLTHLLAGTAVVHAYRVFTSRVEAVLRGFDLSTAGCEVLGLLNYSPDGRMSLAEFKQSLLLHPATLGYTIDTLEKRALIQRCRDLPDRRAVVAELTPDGRTLIRQVIVELSQISFGLSDLSESEASAVLNALAQIGANEPES